MPFIKPERREKIDRSSAAISEPGDLAYKFYKEYKRRWAETPRWTTAHDLYVEYVIDPDSCKLVDEVYSGSLCFGFNDVCAAAQLAWQVFMAEVVLPYEAGKKAENGDVN